MSIAVIRVEEMAYDVTTLNPRLENLSFANQKEVQHVVFTMRLVLVIIIRVSMVAWKQNLNLF